MVDAGDADSKWWEEVEGRNFDNLPEVKPSKKDNHYRFMGTNFKQYTKQV